MKTTHLEIWHAIQGLCKPDPKGNVPWEPVRDKLIDMYGGMADDPNALYLFRYVMGAGGKDGTHVGDMNDFIQVFVNPKFRKMQMGVYFILSSYPV